MSCSLLGSLPSRAELDGTVRQRLAASIDYVAREAGDHLDFNRESLSPALDRIARYPQVPGVAARYYDLVFAITSNQLDKASDLISEIIALSATPAEFRILRFSRDLLGSDFERFPRLLFAESPAVGPLVEPSESEFKQASANLEDAVAIVRAIDPAIYEDIAALFQHIYVSKDSKEPGVVSFGGVTSFLVWGGSFVNIKAYRSRVDMVQFLVHEVTHALLFALSVEEPLVLNPASENYESPLRKDPRPMDGIYHATLVCARLADFNAAWLKSPSLAAEDRQTVQALFDHTLSRFQDGCNTIDQHGKLSVQGRDLLERCRQGLARAA